MRTHRTMAIAATLSLAAGMAATDLSLGAVAASADSFAPPTANELSALRSCESGGNYGTATGNGYYGAYQFSVSTWQSLGYSGYPNQASPATQDQAAVALHASQGWSPWPGCSRSLGLSSRSGGGRVVAAEAAPPIPVVERPPTRQEERAARSASRQGEREQRSAQRRRDRDQRSVSRRIERDNRSQAG